MCVIATGVSYQGARNRRGQMFLPTKESLTIDVGMQFLGNTATDGCSCAIGVRCYRRPAPRPMCRGPARRRTADKSIQLEQG